MKLRPDDQKALQEALRGVRVLAWACTVQPDTGALNDALCELWALTRKAIELNRECAERARQAEAV